MIFGTLPSPREADVERDALERPQNRRFRFVAIAVVVTWLPLFLIALWNGTAFGDRVLITFLADLIPHGRYLIALPLLLGMRVFVPRRTQVAINELLRNGVVTADHGHELSELYLKVTRAWNSPVALLAVIALSYVAALPGFLWQQHAGVSSWMFQSDAPNAQLSVAGAWNLLFGAPLVRALIFYNFWRLLVWIWLLARIARWELNLNALHFDGRCGLRFLGETQLAFAPLIAALAIQLGCALVIAVRFEDLSLPMLQLVLVTFVALSLVFVFAPLAMFSRSIWLEKERAESEFSVWSGTATAYLIQRLYRAPPEQVIEELNTSEISSVTDAAALFDRAHAIRPLPIDLRTLAIMALAAIVPSLLPIATLLPTNELISRIIGIVL